jgi:hypothetical protein
MAETLILLPLLYLVVAKLRRREASWPVLAMLAVPFFTLQALAPIPPSTVFAATALIVLVWGTGDGQLRRPGAVEAAVHVQANAAIDIYIRAPGRRAGMRREPRTAAARRSGCGWPARPGQIAATRAAQQRHRAEAAGFRLPRPGRNRPTS